MKKEYFEKIVKSICECGIKSERIDECLTDVIQLANANGDTDVADLIRKRMGERRTYSYETRKTDDFGGYEFMRYERKKPKQMFFTKRIEEDIGNAIKGIKKRCGINRILLTGRPGTGKTEAARLMAERLDTHFFAVDCVSLVNSKLGETPKNIAKVFATIANADKPTIFFFDEVDSILNSRGNSRDVEEMSRVITAFMRGLDCAEENPDAIIVCATNLGRRLDNALLRRFDVEIEFNEYDFDTLDQICRHYVDLLWGFGK